MKHGARKILKAEKFQVKLLLYLFISQLQIPDLISIPLHNKAVTNLIRNSWNACTNATSRSTSFITSKVIINMNVLCISQFQERTSPHAFPGVLHLFSAQVPGICTI